MRTWQKVVACVAALAATSGASVAAARSGGSDRPVVESRGGMRASGPTRDLGGGVTQTQFVTVDPCRLVDTRVKGGPIASNASRTFRVTGTTHFVDQGGKSGGCGIPVGASAVEVSVTSVDSTGNGYLRIYPAGNAEPNATFLNYSPYNPTNTGTVKLCQPTCSSGQLAVKGHGSSTQVVIDVQGYYVKPLAAAVDSDGSLIRGSRVVATSRFSAGQYSVTFDRAVNTCAFNVSVDINSRLIEVTPYAMEPTKVAVLLRTTGFSLADAPFYLEVTC